MMNEANKSVKPYDDAMKILEGWLQGQLNASGADSIKTPSGTAYRSTITTTKVVNKDMFTDFVGNGHWELAIVGCSKADVKAFMDENQGQPPPGVEVGAIYKINVRRS